MNGWSTSTVTTYEPLGTHFSANEIRFSIPNNTCDNFESINYAYLHNTHTHCKIQLQRAHKLALSCKCIHLWEFRGNKAER